MVNSFFTNFIRVIKFTAILRSQECQLCGVKLHTQQIICPEKENHEGERKKEALNIIPG